MKKCSIINKNVFGGKDMLLYDLIENCSYRDEYQNEHEQCEDCSYGECCPRDCQDCLQYVHYPQKAPAPRKYDCVHMADCYYCKYAYKYASEIVYGLRQFNEIRNKKELKIMSVGCGPCTELAAVDYLKEQGVLNYDRLQYRGIDPLEDVWKYIWNDIREYYGNEIKFYPNDILQLVDIIVKHSWVPDVLIFQYVFSDMYKHADEEEIIQFINKLAEFLNSYEEKPIYILCNDINLSKSMGGGREFFDILESKIMEPKIVRKMHFDNINKDRHYEYGEQYNSNALVFNNISDEIKNAYNPFESCASAQILIEKERKR